MIYFNIAFGIVAVISIVFLIFHPKDVLGFWVVAGKKVCSGIWKLLKGIFGK